MISLCYCDNCKHKKENKGYQMTCEAFPDGIPYGYDFDKVKEIKECNNGIGYEEGKSS